MLNQKDLDIQEEYGNYIAPHQIRVRHIPSGVMVMGNTGSEEHKEALRNTLIQALEKCIPTAVNAPMPQVEQGMADELAAMRAELAAMRAEREVKKPGRPRKAEA